MDLKKMLSRLSGRSHEVYSTVCIAHWGRGRAVTFTERSTVFFRPLTREQIAAYLSRIDPLDKAGAYAAQEGGEEIIERVKGSWTNVVGLPIEGLREAIDRRVCAR